MSTYKDSSFHDINFNKNYIQYRSHVIEYNCVHSFQVSGRKLVMITSKKNEPTLSIHFTSHENAVAAMRALRELRYHGECQNDVIRRAVQILG